MKTITKFLLPIFTLATFLTTINTFAQSSGFINRQATTTAGRLVLDPNNDGYTSATTAGFASDDVGNS